MLSYQHHYHAGNFADVLKHWVLIECVQHLQKKPKAFDYIDTHAGSGYYALDSIEATKTNEAANGVFKLKLDALPGFEPYKTLIENDLKKPAYPGSPEIVKRMLRDTDKAWLYELHPRSYKELSAQCTRRQGCFVKQEDGFKGLLSLLPNKHRRALVLIDPSYEIKEDYAKVVEVMAKAYQKMPQTMIALWYPVVERRQIDTLVRDIQTSTMRNVQQFELSVADDLHRGMTGSGMIVVNPPWTLAQNFNAAMPAVADVLAEDGVRRLVHQVLVEE